MTAPTTHALAGQDVVAQWNNPSDYSTCKRCGITRRTRPDRSTDICVDCRIVETRAARLEPEPIDGGTWTYRRGIWRWTADPEPLTAEDWAWCRAAEEVGKRLQNERENRRGWFPRNNRQHRKDAA